MGGVAARQAPADKYDARRNQLAESALRTLGELGYARTSLREIANNSDFSHGVVHYYFDDKLELIIYCVRYYKARCVTRYDAVIAESTTAAGLVEAFAAKLAETIRDEAPMHRLWYDLRTQSMFEDSLREAVTMIDKTLEEMIWRVVVRYAQRRPVRPTVDGRTCRCWLAGRARRRAARCFAGHGAQVAAPARARPVMPRWLIARRVRCGCRPGPQPGSRSGCWPLAERRQRGAVVLAAELGLEPLDRGSDPGPPPRAGPGRGRPDHRRAGAVPRGAAPTAMNTRRRGR